MSARSALYRAARVLGDAQAVAKGPAALGRRVVRKRVYARTNGLVARLLRKVRL